MVMLRIRKRREAGFTMVEMLVVIAIITILAGLLLAAIHGARVRGRRVKCQENMRGLHRAIVMYRDSYLHWRDDAFPYRLTMLKSIDYKECFICPEDDSEGMQGGKPNASTTTQFAELDEHDKPGCLPLSYMYEFSGAACSWAWETHIGPRGAYYTTDLEVDSDGDGVASWGEVKWAQLKYGDDWLHSQSTTVDTYPPSKFPILRCFWHTSDPDSKKEIAVLNLAFQGNVFFSGAQWEVSTHH